MDEEAPEWSESDFKKAKRLSDMPAEFQQAIRRARGPQKSPTKIQTTIHFDQDVLEGLKATGRGSLRQRAGRLLNTLGNPREYV
ncbi:MAG: BrnA antitoxin family protein [Alcaligenaceae bacterium]|nr:BrnA antitoxin family protein [Alcaligenaceae bacterium]